MTFLNNGVAGGLDRGVAWLRAAADRYREDGPRGVGAFVRETAVGYAV